MVNLKLKKIILEVVDNQLRDNNPPATKQVYQKLLDAGYSVDEAKEKIGAIVVTEIYNVMKEGQVYNEKRYIQVLEEMLQQSLDHDDTHLIHTEWDEWDCLAERGYQVSEEEKIVEMLDYWEKAWEIFQKIMGQEDEKKTLEGLMEELDYQYPIDEWLQDYEMELGNANQHEKRIEFCNSILEIFDWSYDDNSNFLASIGESLYALGKVDEGRAWFEDWLKKEPDNDFAWVVFSGCIQKQEGTEQAYQLIRKKVMNVPCTMKNHLLFERAKVLAHRLQLKKDLKWIATQLNSYLDALEQAEYYNDLYDDFRMPMQHPLVKEKKVYPNDPCPCGSGKKHKKCCGRK